MEKSNIPIHDFHTDDDSSISFRLIPLQLKTHYDSSVPHRHNYYEIFVFTKGGGQHEIDFTNFEIQSRSLHFVSPGQVHCVDRELGTYGYVILFSREFVVLQKENSQSLFDLPFLHDSRQPLLNFGEEEFKEIIGYINKMETESESESQFQEEILRSLLKILLLHCAKKHTLSHPEDKAYYDSSLMTQFRITLEHNFREYHKVQDYASILKTTEKTLAERIKAETGKNVSELIFARIILEAKRLLRHSELTTKEIAYGLGFNDPAHFSKFFKARTGQTATDFRQG